MNVRDGGLNSGSLPARCDLIFFPHGTQAGELNILCSYNIEV